MREKVKRIGSLVLAVVLLVSLAGCGKPKTLEGQIQQTANALGKRVELESSEDGWAAIALAKAGKRMDETAYLETLEQEVAECYERDGGLSDYKATEYHRIALTMLALGGDPEQIQGKNGTTINLVADGTWNFPGGSPGLQGSNGLIYALLLLDAGDYEPPADKAQLRKEYVEELLSYQKESGAFCLDNSLSGDIDITAMAVQALAPYEENEAKEAVMRALNWLADRMTEDGGFIYEDSDSSESSSQMILALCALGRDPAEDEQFRKNGTDLLTGLDRYRLKNGMYVHTTEGGKENKMATWQALLALEAVERLRTGGGWIYTKE